MDKNEKFSDLKKCFKLSKVKVFLPIIYLLSYILIYSRDSYNSYLYSGGICQMEGGCMPPYITYYEYIFGGKFYHTSVLFSEPLFFLIMILVFLVGGYVINSFIHYIYIKLKEVLKK